MSRKNRGLRTCLYSNKHFDRQELIRLVKVDNELVIDRKQDMQGRGFWLKPTSQALNDPKLAVILSKRTKCSVSENLLKELNHEKGK